MIGALKSRAEQGYGANLPSGGYLMQLITARQADEIRQALANVPSHRGLDPGASLDFFLHTYIRPAQKHMDISRLVLLDCGCGVCFLAHAYVLAGRKRVIAVDISRKRIQVSRGIGEALGIGNRVEYVQGSIEDLPFRDRCVDIFASIETLEHVGKRRYEAVAEINRLTKQLIILTTPNLWSPVISHDTGLPLAHWMPARLRQIYARLFRRQNWNRDNMFLNPLKLNRLLRDFQRVSRVLTFETFEEWVSMHPYYLPYGGKSRSGGKGIYVSLKRGNRGTIKYYYYRFLALVRPLAPYLSHNLAGLYVRKRYP